MKKASVILAVIAALLLATTSSFAGRGYYRYSPGYHHGYRHYDSDEAVAGLIVGALIGGLFVSALTAPSPPPRVIYVPSPAYPAPPQTGFAQPDTCIQERTIRGEWQRNAYDGSMIWVTYRYPIVRRYQVSCY